MLSTARATLCYGVVVKTGCHDWDTHRWWEEIHGYHNPHEWEYGGTVSDEQKDKWSRSFIDFISANPLHVDILHRGDKLIVADTMKTVEVFGDADPEKITLADDVIADYLIREFSQKYFNCSDEPGWLLCADIWEVPLEEPLLARDRGGCFMNYCSRLCYGIIVAHSCRSLDAVKLWGGADGHLDSHGRNIENALHQGKSLEENPLPVELVYTGKCLIVASKESLFKAHGESKPVMVSAESPPSDASAVIDFSRKYFNCFDGPGWLLCADTPHMWACEGEL